MNLGVWPGTSSGARSDCWLNNKFKEFQDARFHTRPRRCCSTSLSHMSHSSLSLQRNLTALILLSANHHWSQHPSWILTTVVSVFLWVEASGDNTLLNFNSQHALILPAICCPLTAITCLRWNTTSLVSSDLFLKAKSGLFFSLCSLTLNTTCGFICWK